MPVVELKSRQEFEQYKSQYPILIVDIFGDWCSPCKMVAPKYEELSNMYASNNTNILFTKANVDNRIIDNVSGLPTFQFYFNGQLYQQVLGADMNQVQQILHKIMPDTSQPQQQQQASAPGAYGKARSGRRTNGYKSFSSM